MQQATVLFKRSSMNVDSTINEDEVRALWEDKDGKGVSLLHVFYERLKGSC